MLYKIFFSLWIFILISLSEIPQTLAVPPVHERELLSGEAKLDDGGIFYREVHFDTSETDHRNSSIRYQRPDGKTFAELTSSASTLIFLPDTHYEDHRDQYEYKMEVVPATSIVRLSVRNSDHEIWKSSEEKIDENTFILQTLPIYLQKHESELDRLKKIEAKIVVPSRRSVDRVVIEAREDSRPPALKSHPMSHDRVVELHMKPASFLLRHLLPESVLYYNISLHQVEEFSGVSNILDDHDHAQHVTVRYTLPKVKP